jgi:hypothetical protein
MSEASGRQVLITSSRHTANEPIYHTGECGHVRRRGRDGYREVPMGALNDRFRECSQCEGLSLSREPNACPLCGEETMNVAQHIRHQCDGAAAEEVGE